MNPMEIIRAHPKEMEKIYKDLEHLATLVFLRELIDRIAKAMVK